MSAVNDTYALNPADSPLEVGARTATSLQSSVTQHGVTWTFDEEYPVGQFVSGDSFVVAPSGLSITNIDPLPTSGRNGTMIDPVADFGISGFDDRVSQSNVYNDSENDGLSLPLAVPAESAVVSSISASSLGSFAGIGSSISSDSSSSAYQNPLSSLTVLTVLTESPLVGSFRPGYCGSDRTIHAQWNEDNIDYSKLGSLTPEGSITDIDNYAQLYSRVKTDFQNGYQNRSLHVHGQQPSYGRDICQYSMEAGLLLHLNYTNAQKRDLLIGYLQWGIDNYVRLRAGGSWWADGAQNSGRKLPTIMAGVLLNDSVLLAEAATGFAEDTQHVYISASDVTDYTYPSEQIGVAEWFEKGDKGDPGWLDETAGSIYPPNNGGNRYRDLNWPNNGGTCLAALILSGGKVAWSDDAFFDYHDRCKNGIYESWSEKPETVSFQGFAEDMWNAYRSSY